MWGRAVAMDRARRLRNARLRWDEDSSDAALRVPTGALGGGVCTASAKAHVRREFD